MAKPKAFKARARKALRAAAPYCTQGERFDRRVRDAADWLRISLDDGKAASTIEVLLNELNRALTSAT